MEDAGGGGGVDVVARLEGADEAGVLGQVGDAAQLDLKPSAGTNALRNSLPISERTGMLWRLGASDDRRPVRATVWLNVAWIRPSGATSASSASP